MVTLIIGLPTVQKHEYWVKIGKTGIGNEWLNELKTKGELYLVFSTQRNFYGLSNVK